MKSYETLVEFIPENLKEETPKDIEMEIVEYEPVETLDTDSKDHYEEITEDVQDCSGLYVYCCQEYFDTFEKFLCHMEKNHFGTLRKCIGAKKDLIQKCLDQNEQFLLEENVEECWVEEKLDEDEPVGTEETNDESIVKYETLNEDEPPQPEETISSHTKFILLPINPLPEKPLEPDSEKLYQCSTCEKMCVGLYGLRKHERKHHPPLICDICNASFYNRTQLKAHLFKHRAIESGKTEDLICSFCEMTFSTTDEVEAHRTEYHTRKETESLCEFCSKPFWIKYDLLTHIRKRHSGYKKVDCKLCYKWINNDEELKAHLIEHEKEDSVCNECGKIFKGRKILHHHVQYYHRKCGYQHATKNRKLHCSVCDKAFTYPNQVKNHEINIHGIGEAAFFCTTCKKGFAKKWDLQNHEKMHSDVKPFKCEQCPMDFRRSTHLKSHVLNKHTPVEEKPAVVCLKCHKEFKCVESLRKHVIRAHDMTMNEMYKQMGIPYNGRDILSSKSKMSKSDIASPIQWKMDDGTIEIEIVGATIEENM